MSRKSNKWLYLILCLTVAFISCDRKTIYHHYEHTPLAGWEKEDTLFFAIGRMTHKSTLQRDVELRTADNYPFRSLSLIVEQTVLPSGQMSRDTIDCDLTTPDGNIIGQGITLYQYRYPLPAVSLNEGDSISLRIYHNMRREVLAGIADVGIRLTTY